jgi:hypothetical protein
MCGHYAIGTTIGSPMAKDVYVEEERESRWEASAVVLLVIAMQVMLATASRVEDWTTAGLSWWVWLIPVAPEVSLVIALAWERPHRRLVQLGIRRHVSIALAVFVTLANALLLVAVIASLVRGQETSGAQLLLKALTVWGTNVIAFGLLYWEFDRGGPVARRERPARFPDFQFPQMENPTLAPPDWLPRLLDYVYVSFTNSIAFSPTDAMPLSRWAKMLMLSESATSSLTVLLVAARAVNIFR